MLCDTWLHNDELFRAQKKLIIVAKSKLIWHHFKDSRPHPQSTMVEELWLVNRSELGTGTCARSDWSANREWFLLRTGSLKMITIIFLPAREWTEVSSIQHLRCQCLRTYSNSLERFCVFFFRGSTDSYGGCIFWDLSPASWLLLYGRECAARRELLHHADRVRRPSLQYHQQGPS